MQVVVVYSAKLAFRLTESSRKTGVKTKHSVLELEEVFVLLARPHSIIAVSYLCVSSRYVGRTLTELLSGTARTLLDWDKSLWCSWMVEHEQDEIATVYSTPPYQAISDEKILDKDLQVRHVSVSSVFFAG